MNLEQARKSILIKGKPMTQTELAKKARISPSTIGNIESGHYTKQGKTVKDKTKLAIAKALKMNVNEIEF